MLPFWRWVAGVQAGVIATFLFCWLSFAKDAVTKEEMAKEIAKIPAPSIEWRVNTDARIKDLEAHWQELKDLLKDHRQEHTDLAKMLNNIDKDLDTLKGYHKP